ncbi:MAG: DUF6249 domain-containing protein [Chitinophagales bacterium]
MSQVLIPLVCIPIFFLSIFGIIYIIVTSSHRERMALIENGVDASIFYAPKPKNEGGGRFYLKVGFLAMGIGSGLLLGTLLDTIGFPSEPSYFSMIFLCGGVGLLSYYLFIERRNKEDEVENYEMMKQEIKEELAEDLALS